MSEGRRRILAEDLSRHGKMTRATYKEMKNNMCVTMVEDFPGRSIWDENGFVSPGKWSFP